MVGGFLAFFCLILLTAGMFWAIQGYVSYQKAVKEKPLAQAVEEIRSEAQWVPLKQVQGGSTITQQLVKNMYYDQNKTLARKAAEAWTALYVERQLSKEEILELYINTIYFGDGYYGLKEASRGYFGKEPQDLTDSEAVLLAGIPNAPSAYAPSRHADLALQREKQVLAAMVKYGYLEQSETDSLLWDAAADPVLAR